MRLTCIADTHNKHEEIILPPGDVLIHAGDFTEGGTRPESREFLDWFSAQPYTHKILIAGNHDFFLEKLEEKELKKFIPSNIYYLKDNGVRLENFLFWGSPVTPGLERWAFNRDRGNQIKQHWEKIPQDVDVLVTHTPPYGILDRLSDKTHVGCEALSQSLKVLQPKIHIFGHIHEAYGRTRIGNTTYLNTCCLNKDYHYLHPPITQEI